MSLDELVPCIPALRADEAELQLEARAFAESRLAPGAGKWEAGGAIPADVISELCALGLGGATLPRDVGGAGMTHVGALAVFEELARGDMAVGFALLCQNSCARSIWLHGTPAQRDEWLPSLLSGAELGAYAITEPGAGSDPAGMASTATERDGGFVLDGHKTWISNAPVAGLFVTSVKTDPDLGARGVSTFVVARGTAGLEVGARLSTLGARALTVGEVHFDGCRVSEDVLLGRRDQGFKIALDAVNWARMIWAGLAVGVARSALAEAIAYLRQRVQFESRLIEFQAVQFELADLATEIEAARMLGYRAAELMDRGARELIVAASMAKRYAADTAVHVTSQALELLGGRGYLAPAAGERYLRQARMAQLADGANNIQRLVIARSLV